MTTEDLSIVVDVYRKFYFIDTRTNKDWTVLDEQMSMLNDVSSAQLYAESSQLLIKQKTGNPRCKTDHPTSECFVPTILKAISLILEEYKNNSQLPKEVCFILKFYLSISAVGFIKY